MSFGKGLDSLKFIFLWGKSCVTSTSSIWKDGHAWGICSLTPLFRFKVDLCTGRTRKNTIKARGFFVCYFWTAFYVYRFSLSHSKNKDFKENSFFSWKTKGIVKTNVGLWEQSPSRKGNKTKGSKGCGSVLICKRGNVPEFGIFLQGWLTWYESEEGMAWGPVLIEI